MSQLDDYKFPLLIGSQDIPFGGYVSSIDKTNMAPNLLVEGSINTYVNTAERIVNRCGKKLRGVVDGVEAGTLSSYVWSDSLGDTFPLRTTEEDKLQVELEVDGVLDWYDLMSDLAGKTRFVYAPWWYGISISTANQYVQRDILLMVNGESNIKFWSGGFAIAESVTTINSLLDTVTINAGGINYLINDIVAIDGGSFSQVRVTNTTGPSGIVTGVEIISPGYGYVPASGVATTNILSYGVGLTLDITVKSGYILTKKGLETWSQSGFLNQLATMSNLNDIAFNAQQITVNGNDYTYVGGEDSTTLIFEDANIANVITGDIVFSKVITITDIPIVDALENTMEELEYVVDFLNVLNNQVLIGSYNDRGVYLSSATMFCDFVNGGDLISGDPDFAILDSFPTGIAVRKGDFIVPGGTSDFYIITPNSPLPVQVPVNSDFALIQTKVEKKSGSGLVAALAHELIGTVDDEVVWLAQDHQVYKLGNFKDLFVSKLPSLSQEVKTEFEAEDFTNGALQFVGDDMYITAPVSGKVYIRETRDQVTPEGNIFSKIMWNPPQILNISRIAVINGLIYGHSYNNPQLYQLYDTNQWFDDSPDGPVKYQCVATFAYWNFLKKSELGNLNKIYYEAYILANSDLRNEVLFDYEGETDIQNKILSSASTHGIVYTAPGTSQLGGEQIGVHQLGGGFTNIDFLPKVRIIKTYEVKDCFEYQVSLYSNEIGSRWELVCLGSNGKQIINNPVFLVSNN